MAEAVNPWDVAWEAPATTGAAPWEEKWDEPKKQEEPKKKKPFIYKDEKGIVHIGENLLDLGEDGAAGAAVRAGLSEIPAAGAGAAAFGAAQNTPLVQSLQKSGFMPARIAGMGIPLAAGMAGGMTTGLATRAATKEALPEVAAQLERDAEQHPNAVAAGSVLAQAPFFKPSLALTLKERLVPAAIGSGIAGAQEVYNGTLDEDGLLRVALAGAGNAVFTNPTAAGNAAMNLGAKISNPITSRLGSVKAGDPLPKVVANTNDIALSGPSEPPAPPVPLPDPMSLGMLEKGQSGLPKEAAGSPKATQEKLDTKATIPDPETGAPITVDLAGPLGDFEPTEPFIPKKLTDTEVFNRRVKGVIDNLAKEGVEIDRQTAVKLARTTDRKEFNAARQKLIDSVKPPEIPAEGPLEKAETKAVSEQTPKETATPASTEKAPAAEAAPAPEPDKPAARVPTQAEDFARYTEIDNLWKAIVNKAKTDPTPENTKAAVDAINTLMPENEQIKNRYGGMPPEAPSVTPKVTAGPEKGVSGGTISSEAGSVINPVTPALEAVGRGVGKVNDAMLESMAKADVEATNPLAKKPSIFDAYVGHVTEEPKTEEVQFAKPGEGRKQTKAERRALEDTSSYEGDLLPVKDSITGERIPEHEAANAKTIYERMTAKAKESNSLEIDKAYSDAVAKVPEHYTPLLTDLASRFPSLGKTEAGAAVSRIIGTAAKVIKNRLGLSEDNIGDVLPAAKGKVYERDHFIGKLTNRLVGETEQFGKLARKALSKEDFLKLEKATLSGDEEAILSIFKGKAAGPELQAAYERNQAAKAAGRQMLIEAGRDVGEVEAYFQRIVHDREGLIKELGGEVSLYNDAIRKAKETKGSALTPEEEVKVLNNLVLGSLRNEGGPGFLKKRTIDAITDNILKYYEPFDVADARWSVRVARDIGNRKFFGKIEPDAAGIYTEDSSFGKTISQALRSGELTDRGLKILKDNLEDLYKNDRKFNEAIEKIGSAARKAQTYAYLADAGTALVQFADVFSIAREYGLSSALKGYSGKRLDIGDIGVTEGHNPDMLELSRVPKSKIGKAIDAPYRWSMKNLIGLADGFQKSATVKAATARISKEANTKGSGFFERLEADYKKIFPDRWPQMKKDLQSKDFANGKLNENTSLFLFSELSRLQPINASGRAQGYQTSSSWGKAIYALRSYWLKQVGILRNQAYNEAKRGQVGEGARALATYITVVAVGQQAFQIIKDKVLQREIAPEDYAIGGMLQLAGIPRYAIYRQKQVGTGTAALETIVPGIGLLNDLGKDTALAMKGLAGSRKADGGKAVRGLGDFLEQAESTKYIPAVGREIYSLAGKGKLKEQKERKRVMEGGKPRATTIEEISNFFSPPDLESR